LKNISLVMMMLYILSLVGNSRKIKNYF